MKQRGDESSNNRRWMPALLTAGIAVIAWIAGLSYHAGALSNDLHVVSIKADKNAEHIDAMGDTLHRMDVRTAVMQENLRRLMQARGIEPAGEPVPPAPAGNTEER